MCGIRFKKVNYLLQKLLLDMMRGLDVHVNVDSLLFGSLALIWSQSTGLCVQGFILPLREFSCMVRYIGDMEPWDHVFIVEEAAPGRKLLVPVKLVSFKPTGGHHK